MEKFTGYQPKENPSTKPPERSVVMKFPGKKNKKIPHLWDFEGRCETCHKNLVLYMKPMGRFKLTLEVEKCPEHPDDALILYPLRDDVINSNCHIEPDEPWPRKEDP
jgi:hypothetical protein